MKIKVIVKVEYQFEFETLFDDRKSILMEIEDYWDSLVEFGREEEKYHETIIDYEEK